MIAAERQQWIFEYIAQHRSAKVAQLARIVGVTEETIRRDLDELESNRKIKRYHGGAVALTAFPADETFIDRNIRCREEKVAIGKAAIENIEPQDTLFIDASTTTLQLARLLPDVPLTVITNSYHIIRELTTKSLIHIIQIGGILDRNSMSFIGPPAERSLKAYHVDKSFISCTGVDLERGAFNANEMQSSSKRIMIDHSNAAYLLADHTKFEKKSLSFFAGLDAFDAIITDTGVSESCIKVLQKKHIPIHISRTDLKSLNH